MLSVPTLNVAICPATPICAGGRKNVGAPTVVTCKPAPAIVPEDKSAASSTRATVT